MKDYFFSLVDKTLNLLQGQERLLIAFQGEESHFCRFNQSKIRQMGRISHQRIEMRLENSSRHAALDLTLSTQMDEDLARIKAAVEQLRVILSVLDPDPYFLMNECVLSSDFKQASESSSSESIIEEISRESSDLDLVGFLAKGGIYKGFANSLGQRNWFETENFNFDWSLYLRDDKAVKSQYAGFEWSSPQFRSKMRDARHQLSILDQPTKAIKPGKYRVFLSSSAVHEVMSLLAWRGFGLKSQRTKSSPLVKLLDQTASLSPEVNIMEDVVGGTSPNFDTFGFLKPDRVELIKGGKHQGSLVSPRSSREFGVTTTGAAEGEYPESIQLAQGSLKNANICNELEEGLYINNLWYMNFSDAPSCRMTGMTRFASFWVENGKITQPLAVMRFDDSFYRMFGENLISLTQEQDLILSSSTYDGRSTQSANLPGALLKELQLTL